MPTKSKKDLLVEKAILAPLDWVDERSAAVRGTKWFLFRNVPRDISWAQTLGSAALTAFIVQAVTGVMEGFQKGDLLLGKRTNLCTANKNSPDCYSLP